MTVPSGLKWNLRAVANSINDGGELPFIGLLLKRSKSVDYLFNHNAANRPTGPNFPARTPLNYQLFGRGPYLGTSRMVTRDVAIWGIIRRRPRLAIRDVTKYDCLAPWA